MRSKFKVKTEVEAWLKISSIFRTNYQLCWNLIFMVSERGGEGNPQGLKGMLGLWWNKLNTFYKLLITRHFTCITSFNPHHHFKVTCTIMTVNLILQMRLSYYTTLPLHKGLNDYIRHVWGEPGPYPQQYRKRQVLNNCNSL